MPQDPPNISMLRMLTVLHTITHSYNYPLYKIPHFNHVPLIGEHNIFLDPIACQMRVHFQEDYTALPSSNPLHPILPPWPKF